MRITWDSLDLRLLIEKLVLPMWLTAGLLPFLFAINLYAASRRTGSDGLRTGAPSVDGALRSARPALRRASGNTTARTHRPGFLVKIPFGEIFRSERR